MHVAPERHTFKMAFFFFLFSSSKARVRAMSSANWAEVPGDKGLVSMVSKLKTTVYPALLFPSKTNLPPSETTSEWKRPFMDV